MRIVKKYKRKLLADVVILEFLQNVLIRNKRLKGRVIVTLVN